MKNPYPHKIITLTGPDRCGKTTAIRLLAEALSPSRTLKFPNDAHWSGAILRAILAGEEFHVARLNGCGGWHTQVKEAVLFQAMNAVNRQASQARIADLLASTHLLMDRYDADAYLYGRAEGVELPLLLALTDAEIESDLVLVLYGAAYGGEAAWEDLNDADLRLQDRVTRIGLAMTALDPARYVAVNVDDLSRAGARLPSIWAVHARLCRIIGERLDVPITPLTTCRTADLVRGWDAACE